MTVSTLIQIISPISTPIPEMSQIPAISSHSPNPSRALHVFLQISLGGYVSFLESRRRMSTVRFGVTEAVDNGRPCFPRPGRDVSIFQSRVLVRAPGFTLFPVTIPRPLVSSSGCRVRPSICLLQLGWVHIGRLPHAFGEPFLSSASSRKLHRNSTKDGQVHQIVHLVPHWFVSPTMMPGD